MRKLEDGDGGSLTKLCGNPRGKVEGRRPRLLLVDDDPRVVRNWARVLNATVAVSWAASICQTLEQVAPARWRLAAYDYIVFDIALPDGSGLDLLETLIGLKPRPAIAILSNCLSPVDVLRVHRHNLIALPKPTGRDVILGVVDLLSNIRHGGPIVERFATHYRLSPQESRLLREALREATNDEAADVLGCSPSTVRTYWSRIFQKTSCNNERDVIVRLFQQVHARAGQCCHDTRSTETQP